MSPFCEVACSDSARYLSEDPQDGLQTDVLMWRTFKTLPYFLIFFNVIGFRYKTQKTAETSLVRDRSASADGELPLISGVSSPGTRTGTLSPTITGQLEMLALEESPSWTETTSVVTEP